ncbi:MAG: hypothetical protein WA113_01555 [Desulfitobacteriaceae bacterium]
MKDLTKQHSVKVMCRVLEVSEAGYYKWLKNQGSPYKYEKLLAKIRQIRAENEDDGAYKNLFRFKAFSWLYPKLLLDS